MLFFYSLPSLPGENTDVSLIFRPSSLGYYLAQANCAKAKLTAPSTVTMGNSHSKPWEDCQMYHVYIMYIVSWPQTMCINEYISNYIKIIFRRFVEMAIWRKVLVAPNPDTLRTR